MPTSQANVNYYDCPDDDLRGESTAGLLNLKLGHERNLSEEYVNLK